MAYSDEVLADSPMLYWRLGESSGTNADDSSTNNRDGTLSATGITYSQTGAVAGNNALAFDGSSGSLVTAAVLPLDALSVVTIEFWLKVTAFNNTDDMVCEIGATGGNEFSGWSIDPCASTANWAVWGHCPAGLNIKRYTRPSTGVFHYYAFVLKQSTTTNAIVGYLDGQLWTPESFAETDATDQFAFDLNVYFMARGASSLFLAGTLDEVAIYPTDIGATRVLAHYNAGIGVGEPVQVLSMQSHVFGHNMW